MNNLKVSVFHICEHTSILWELCGIKQQVESRILVDYQYYRVLRWGQAWELPVVCPTTRGLRIALSCRTDNVRAHADMIYATTWSKATY